LRFQDDALLATVEIARPAAAKQPAEEPGRK
jgi:hypothetical protein